MIYCHFATDIAVIGIFDNHHAVSKGSISQLIGQDIHLVNLVVPVATPLT